MRGGREMVWRRWMARVIRSRAAFRSVGLPSIGKLAPIEVSPGVELPAGRPALPPIRIRAKAEARAPIATGSPVHSRSSIVSVAPVHAVPTFVRRKTMIHSELLGL